MSGSLCRLVQVPQFVVAATSNTVFVLTASDEMSQFIHLRP